jgi:hypothetical protein
MACVQHDSETACAEPAGVTVQPVPYLLQDDNDSAAGPHKEPAQHIQVLPHNNIPLVFSLLMLAMFLVRPSLVDLSCTNRFNCLPECSGSNNVRCPLGDILVGSYGLRDWIQSSYCAADHHR